MPHCAPASRCFSRLRARPEPPGRTAQVLKRFSLPLFVLVFSAGLLQSARGQSSAPVLTRSYSGQFCVCAVPSWSPSSFLSNLETNQNLARLAPTLVPTSCERIKQVLWRELGAPASWQGRILLLLAPATSANDPVMITSEQFPDRWQYRVQLPELVDRTRYVRAIVQVLLLEIANRKAGAHSAEIPLWLSEGLTQEIIASSTTDQLIPPPPRPTSDIMRPAASFTSVNARRQNPLESAHNALARTPPLSFQDLSWPTPEQASGNVSELYRDSAQLFVDELLALPDGRACLRRMLEMLPDNYNWQFAFLRAFRSHFQRPLDIEKWWSLQALRFTGRDLAQSWSASESWQKLDELIHSDVQIRYGTNELPVHGEVLLQTIVQDWDPGRQAQALQAKLEGLELLRPRMALELVPLADEYRRVLSGFLREVGNHPGKKGVGRRLVGETVQRLAVLDAQRMAMRPVTPAQWVPVKDRAAGTNGPSATFANETRVTR